MLTVVFPALYHCGCVFTTDVDECGTELARCPSNTYCFNTDGSYECRGQSHVNCSLMHAVCVCLSVHSYSCVQVVIRPVWAVWEADLLAVRNVLEGSESLEQSV